MSFAELKAAVISGMEPTYSGIPIGFPVLGDEITIRPSMGYLTGGYTGSGKTAFIDEAFILNPIEWLLRHPEHGLDIHIEYFSMERKKIFKLGKWVARRMFLDHGGRMPIDVNHLLGWVAPERRIRREDFELFEQYEEYVDALLTKVKIHQGPKNPMAVKKVVDEYAAANGSVWTNPDDPYDKVYTPTNPNQIVLVVYDHIGLTKKERRKDNSGQYITYNTKKECIDLLSDDARHFRDFYGYSYCMVSQFNRDIANPIRIKQGALEPMLEDFKDSGGTQEDSDVVFGLFDAIRYNLAFSDGKDTLGYEINKFRDGAGRKYYRSLHVLKNSYGVEDVGIGLAFQPQIGHFKQMPRARDITTSQIDSVLDNTYFLER